MIQTGKSKETQSICIMSLKFKLTGLHIVHVSIPGLPIPIVAVSAGIRFKDYGNGTV